MIAKRKAVEQAAIVIEAILVQYPASAEFVVDAWAPQASKFYRSNSKIAKRKAVQQVAFVVESIQAQYLASQKSSLLHEHLQIVSFKIDFKDCQAKSLTAGCIFW